MKNIYKKIIAVVLLVAVLFNFSPKTCNAEVNYVYGTPQEEAGSDVIPSSILLEWLIKMAYHFGTLIEGLGKKVVGWFTGKPIFPYSDRIVFNTIPILDPNFINPAEGSLFKDINGQDTLLGGVIRKTYFSSLAIALGFFGLVVAVTAIRLAFSTIASTKAKYKEVIADTIKTLILLFGLHYLLAFCLYLNEQLVTVASTTLMEAITGDKSNEIIKGLEEEAMKNDAKIVENFVDKAGPNWLSPITWARETVKALVNLGYDICHTVAEAFKTIGKAIDDAVSWVKSWFGGGQKDDDGNEEGDLTISPQDDGFNEAIEKVYPSRSGMYEDLKKDDKLIHIAAYLLKDYSFRELYLKWASGTDQNTIDNDGLIGVARGLAVMLNDFLGIVDTGYMNLRLLHQSAFFIRDGYYKALNPIYSVDASDENSLNRIIKSTKDYNNYLVYLDKEIAKWERERDSKGLLDPSKIGIDNKIKFLKTSKIYAGAYYKIIYDGDDKITTGNNQVLTSMGDYFKANAWYIDIDKGEWAPTTISIPFGLLYAIFVIQSLMFFISYIKRLLYIVILSMLGPIVVVFDYMSKAI